MEQNIINCIKQYFKTTFETELSDKQLQLQPTRKEFEGDITLVVFPLVKISKKSPIDLANELGNLLSDSIEEISGFNVVQGFLNLELKDSYWLNIFNSISIQENFGSKKGNGKDTSMVEYSSPNTNKPLHLGHLRNIFLGHSVSEILKTQGKEVIKTQIVNDRGIHICKSMVSWQKFAPEVNGIKESPESTGIKGDKFVGNYYVKFDQELKIQTKEVLNEWENGNFENCSESDEIELNKLFTTHSEKEDEKAKQAIFAKITEKAKLYTPLMRETKDMLIKWEAREPETFMLWNRMNSWVYAGFDITYDTMGVDFDKLYYESDTYILGRDKVLEGLKKGLFFQKEDGSIWVDLTDKGLDEKLLLRGDGTAVYMTQDIGTAIDRYKDYPNLNQVIYTVGNEQDYHFKVLFLVLEKLGYEWAKNCAHLSYGMIELPTGKMKSREGTVVDADDLMNEVILTAKEITQERGQIQEMSETEREELYKTIGLGGLKYFLLKVDPKKKMVFDPTESIDLNGNTGPFIQYTYARINSLIGKAGNFDSINSDVELTKDELNIVKSLNQYPEVLTTAANDLTPAVLCNFIYDLVKNYNSFYASHPILNEEVENKKLFRLNLSKMVADTIKKSMNLLGIEVPNKM